MSDFPLYALSEEHQAIREAVRAVCDAKVAPYAADVDEQARYPREAADALRAADFHAPHVPEEYGGAGADALATCLVIEEVARACVSSSLIPAVNKLGSLPVQIAGSEELKKHYLGKLAAGEGGFSYCLSEPDAGSDAGRHEDPGREGRRRLGAQRRQAVDHQRRGVGVLHRAGGDRSGEADPRRHHRLRRREVRRRRLLRRPREEARHQGQPDPRGLPRRRTDPRRPGDRRGRRGVPDRHEHPGPHPGHDRGPGRRRRPGCARPRPRVREGAAAVRAAGSRSSRGCSSCWPTWG